MYNKNHAAYIRVGPRSTVIRQCIVLPWTTEIKYLGVHIGS